MSGSCALPFQLGATFFSDLPTDINGGKSLEGNKFTIPFIEPLSPGLANGGQHRGESVVTIVRWAPSVSATLENTANSLNNNSPRGLLMRFAATANHGFYVDSRASADTTESFAGFVDPFVSAGISNNNLFYVISEGLTYCAVAGTGVTAGTKIQLVPATPGYVQNVAAGRVIGRALETVAASTLPGGPVNFALCQIDSNLLAD